MKKNVKCISGLLIFVMVLSLFCGTAFSANAKSGNYIKLNKKTITLVACSENTNYHCYKKKIKLKVVEASSSYLKKVTWKSSNEDVAEVNKKGVVTASRDTKGDCKIYAISKKNKSVKAVCKVKVRHSFNLGERDFNFFEGVVDIADDMKDPTSFRINNAKFVKKISLYRDEDGYYDGIIGTRGLFDGYAVEYSANNSYGSRVSGEFILPTVVGVPMTSIVRYIDPDDEDEWYGYEYKTCKYYINTSKVNKALKKYLKYKYSY